MTDNESGPSPTRSPLGPTIENDEDVIEIDSQKLLEGICSRNGTDFLVPDEGSTTNEFYDEILPDDYSEPTPLEENND